MSHGGSDPRKVVIAALTGNGVIALAKFAAAYFSGSVTMVAEGVHSLADTANQGLLLVGMVLALKKDPLRFPLGRSKELYFWAFIVSLLLFFLGGVFAISEGIAKLREAHGHGEGNAAAGSMLWPVIVLAVSIIAEGGSFLVAFREFDKSRNGKPFFAALFGGKDPTIPLVLLEDTGAMIGLVVALLAIGVSWLTKSPAVDALGSIVIGLLLCSIGVLLAKDTHSLLIGEGISPELRADIVAMGVGVDGIEAVSQVLSLYLGPNNVLLALKVRFTAGMMLSDIERTTQEFERRLRDKHPELTRIFVEADSTYDPSKDSEYA